jgi:hypothetical protein
MRRLLTITFLIASLTLLTDCGERPSAPSPPIQVDASPPPSPAPQPAASLAIEALTIRESHPTDRHPFYGYDVRFWLRETSGVSGAIIRNVFYGDLSGSGDNVGPGCWRHDLRVQPGRTIDTFYSDEGIGVLADHYCWTGTSSRTALAHLRVVVDFTDDDGRAGVVEVIATIPR